jgi:hypothetical protein
MTVMGWKPIEGRVVKALVRLATASGLIFNECSYCVAKENRWVTPTQRRGNGTDGEPDWVDLLEFVSPDIKARFQHEALQAVDRFLEGSRHGF